MNEAIKRIISFAFDDLNVYLMTSGCLEEHQVSARLLLKNGFKESSLGEKNEYHQAEFKKRINFELYKS